VLQGVGNEFIDDQGARDDRVDVEINVLNGYPRSNAPFRRTVGEEEVGRQAFHILGKIDSRQRFGLIQLFMDQRHGVDPVLALPEEVGRLPVPDVRHLQVEQTADDLEVVLDPVVHLLEQDLFFPQGLPDPFLRLDSFVDQPRIFQRDGRLGGEQFRHLGSFRRKGRGEEMVFEIKNADHPGLLDHRQAEDGPQLSALDFRIVPEIALLAGVVQDHTLPGPKYIADDGPADAAGIFEPLIQRPGGLFFRHVALRADDQGSFVFD